MRVRSGVRGSAGPGGKGDAYALVVDRRRCRRAPAAVPSTQRGDTAPMTNPEQPPQHPRAAAPAVEGGSTGAPVTGSRAAESDGTGSGPETALSARGLFTLAGALLLVAGVAALAYLPFLGSGRVLTDHEVMVSQPALQLLEDGQWIVPRYANQRWLDKPPLVNWITAGFFVAAGGFGEWPARLPAALSGIALAVLVAWLGGRLYGPRVGLWAGLVQATVVAGFIQARLGEIDMPFTLLVTATHGVLLWCWRRGDWSLRPLPAALFYLLAALAVLAKGPIGAVLPGLTVVGTSVAVRSLRPLKAVLFTPSIVAFLAVAGGWHVAAYAVAGDQALQQWVYNNLSRFAGGHHLGGKGLPFYFYTIPWLMLPWTFVLIGGARRLWQDVRRADAAAERFLWAWFVAGFVFLTISRFKHHQYCLPLLPPLCLLSGRLVVEWIERWRPHARRIAVGTVAAMLVAFLVVGGYVMPRRDHRRPTVEFVRALGQHVPPGTTVYVTGLGLSNVYPYLAYRPVAHLFLPAEINAAMRDLPEEPLWVLTLRQHMPKAEQEGLRVEEVASEPPGRKRGASEDALVLARITRADVRDR